MSKLFVNFPMPFGKLTSYCTDFAYIIIYYIYFYLPCNDGTKKKCGCRDSSAERCW